MIQIYIYIYVYVLTNAYKNRQTIKLSQYHTNTWYEHIIWATKKFFKVFHTKTLMIYNRLSWWLQKTLIQILLSEFCQTVVNFDKYVSCSQGEGSWFEFSNFLLEKHSFFTFLTEKLVRVLKSSHHEQGHTNFSQESQYMFLFFSVLVLFWGPNLAVLRAYSWPSAYKYHMWFLRLNPGMLHARQEPCPLYYLFSLQVMQIWGEVLLSGKHASELLNIPDNSLYY